MKESRLFRVEIGLTDAKHLPWALEIVQDDSGIFLYSLDEAGQVNADTWHQTLDQAFEQAKFQFGVECSDWTALKA